MLSTNQSGQSFPGLTLKAWALVQANGTVLKSFNITSVTKGTTGIYTYNFTSAMATTTYTAKVQFMPTISQPNIAGVGVRLTTSGQIYTQNSALAVTDLEHYVEWWE